MTTHPTQLSLNDLLQLPEQTVFKDDKRSKVWLVNHQSQPLVIKQFKNHPLRQRFTWLIQYHPAQRESRMATHLASRNLPVVPILLKVYRQNSAFLITPYVGKQIFDRFYWKDLTEPQPRAHVINHVANLINLILSQGYIFRDCKLSNMVLDDNADTIHLIDVMSFSKSKSPARITQMLTILNETAIEAGWSRDERTTFYNAINIPQPLKNKLLAN